MAAAVLCTKINEFENKIPAVAGLVNKTDYDVETSDIETKYSTTAGYNRFTEETLEETRDWSFIWGKSYFGDDCFQNMLIYQSIIDTLEFKKDQVTDCSQMEVEGLLCF